MKDFKFSHLGQNLLLHPYKSLYWIEQQILLIADLHLGKATHFRKSGIPIPEMIHHPDFDRIIQLVKTYNPKRIVFLGDLFHSTFNNSWLIFKKFYEKNIRIRTELVMGNHDILSDFQYDFLEIHLDNLIIDPFVLSHRPIDISESGGLYNLCGHIHPSVRISGTAKQSLRVECFYFGKNHGILPAFGNFTGTYKIPKRASTDKIFGVTNEKIIQLF